MTGYNFNINIEKSRYVKEKSKIPILVTFDGGISKYTGILDMAVESGEVIKPSNGWYNLIDKSTGENQIKKLKELKARRDNAAVKKYLNEVKVAAEKFSYYGHQGSYKDWKELGKWVYDDLIKSRQELPAQTIQMVNELVKGAANDKEKARRIYEFLQKKTRYISVQVGIGGFQPFAASEVDRLSYGDCKALVNYTHPFEI